MEKKKLMKRIMIGTIAVFVLAGAYFPDDPGIAHTAEVLDLAETNEDFATFIPIRQRKKKYVFNENDEYVLLQIAMAEAGDQDVAGKALVMNVILNRIRDEEFPDTIEDVVMQEGQFQPVDNGSFWEVVPDAGCVDALELVAAGWDRSAGATYFEETYAGSWQSVNLEKLFVHGCHTFYKDYA